MVEVNCFERKERKDCTSEQVKSHLGVVADELAPARVMGAATAAALGRLLVPHPRCLPLAIAIALALALVVSLRLLCLGRRLVARLRLRPCACALASRFCSTFRWCHTFSASDAQISIHMITLLGERFPFCGNSERMLTPLPIHT